MNIATTSSSASALLLITNANRPGSWTPVVPAAIAAPPQAVTVSAVPSQGRVDAQSRIVEALTVYVGGTIPERTTAADWKSDPRNAYLFEENTEPPIRTEEDRIRARERIELRQFASRALGARNAQLLTAQRGNFRDVDDAKLALSEAISWLGRGLRQINEFANRGEVTLEDFAHLGAHHDQMMYERYRNPSQKFQQGIDTFRIGEAFLRNTMGVEGDNLVRGEDGRYTLKTFETEIAGRIFVLEGDSTGVIRINDKPAN